MKKIIVQNCHFPVGSIADFRNGKIIIKNVDLTRKGAKIEIK